MGLENENKVFDLLQTNQQKLGQQLQITENQYFNSDQGLILCPIMHI